MGVCSMENYLFSPNTMEMISPASELSWHFAIFFWGGGAGWGEHIFCLALEFFSGHVPPLQQFSSSLSIGIKWCKLYVLYFKQTASSLAMCSTKNCWQMNKRKRLKNNLVFKKCIEGGVESILVSPIADLQVSCWMLRQLLYLWGRSFRKFFSL